MGFTGLTGRLKRLSDAFIYQARDFYRANESDIEPNWHMIFLLLKKYEKMTVTEIAEALQLSHPAIVKLVTKMKIQGYIKSELDPMDNRKYQLMLSPKAIKELPVLQEYWVAGEMALQELLGFDTRLLEEIQKLEDRMAEADYKTRMDRWLAGK